MLKSVLIASTQFMAPMVVLLGARHISLCLTVGYQFPRRTHHIRIPLRINLIGLCQKAHICIREDTYLPDLPPRKYWRRTTPCITQMSIDIRALGSHYLVYQLDSKTKPSVTLNYRCLAAFWEFAKEQHPCLNAFNKTIITDQAKGLVDSVKLVLPAAGHFHCS